jgi:hypothetical protein
LHWGRWLSLARKKLSLLVVAIAHAPQETLVILAAKTKAISNYNTYVGILMISVAPCAEIVYKLFDSHEGTGYWNTYYFLYEIGPHVSILLILFGIFLLFSKWNKMRFALIIPASYKFSKIIWLASVTNNDDFHRVVPGSFLIIGLSVSIVWFKTFDWLMKLHFHKKEGTIDRMVGSLNTPGIDEHQAYLIARGEAQRFIELNSQ